VKPGRWSPRAQGDGLTFLDLVWAQAPFASRGQFQRTVAGISADWVQAGLLTAADRDKIVTAATHSHLGHQ